jgi:hypothetical protein
MIEKEYNKKIYATKYALTDGIQEYDAIVLNDGTMVECKNPIDKNHVFNCHRYFHKGEFFFTREEAIDDANKRLKRKIESLKKQISKLEKKSFT